MANLGRNLIRPEGVADGSAEKLLRSVKDLTAKRNEMAIVRIAATDNAQQILFENLGYACVGFQPLKHMLQQRVGVLFYVHGANSILVTRTPLSESLPDVSELSAAVLDKLQIPNAMVVRDGASGYPLQCDLKVHEATMEEYQTVARPGRKFQSACGSVRALQLRVGSDAHPRDSGDAGFAGRAG